MTGLWQVEARAHSTFGEALDLDVAYVRGWSLGLDLRLLLRTPLLDRSASGRPADGAQPKRHGRRAEADPRRRRRPRLLGPEPRSQPRRIATSSSSPASATRGRSARGDRAGAIPDVACTTPLRGAPRDATISTPSRSRRPSPRTTRSAMPRSRRASTSSSRSRSRRPSEQVVELIDAGRERRPRPHARATRSSTARR